MALQVLGRAGLRAMANYGPAVGIQGHSLLTSLRGFSAQAQEVEGAEGGRTAPCSPVPASCSTCMPSARPQSDRPCRRWQAAGLWLCGVVGGARPLPAGAPPATSTCFICSPAGAEEEQIIERKGIQLHGAPMYLDMQASGAAAVAGGGAAPAAAAARRLGAASRRRCESASCLTDQQARQLCRLAMRPLMAACPHNLRPLAPPIACRPPPPWTLAWWMPCCPS